MNFYPISSSTKVKATNYLKKICENDPGITYSWLLEDIYDHDYKLLPPHILKQSINISSGVSDAPTYQGFLNRITQDILEHKYYKDYSAAQGNYNLRRFLAATENSRSDILNYSLEDICITEGASGAVSSVVEYVSKYFTNPEIIIPVPSYYGYKVAAIHHGVNYREVILSSSPDSPSFSSLLPLIDAISSDTKLIMVTYPDNPSGLLYPLDEIKQLLLTAKAKNILVIFDQVFLDLVFKEKTIEVDILASELSAYENFAIIRSFSKNHNLPGLRIGYLLSKSNHLIKYITKIQESRVLFATGSSHKGLFHLEGVLRTINNLAKRKPEQSLEEIIERIIKNSDMNLIEKLTKKELIKIYIEYQAYKMKLLDNYARSYKKAMALLKEYSEEVVPAESAFNTFVKLKDMQGINMFDFCLNLFLSTGLKIALGPYFGLTQQEWENNKQLGFWLRITFGINNKDLESGINILIHFLRKYRSEPEKFLRLQKYF